MNRKIIAFFAAGTVGIILTGLALLYFSGPSGVRQPTFEHLHFRLQLVVSGQRVDFSQPKYQVHYEAGCTAELAPEPFHFHDQKSQMVHVHWKHMTGGLWLKYYGWNLIGGIGDTLGYRFDAFPSIGKVPLQGSAVLPDWPKDAKLWVYTGDETKFKPRSPGQFLYQDFETFFGVQSNINIDPEQSLLGRLFMPRAAAHAGHVHGASDEPTLEDINNLVGNVVIFVQKERPSDSEVRTRFAQLEPLSPSTCGG